MSLSPELSIALQRITACNKSERLLMVVRDDLMKSLQAGQTAVAYAHEAWMQLERLGADVMSIGRLVGFVDRDKLHKAFKDSKLLMRDRVVWQAMGRFRTMLDTQVIMDYLAIIVNSDNTRLSQLRNAYYKVQSDVVAEAMASYYSWEKFARNVCGNVEDDDMQAVLMNLGRLVDLSDQNFYPSLMEVPFIVNDALSKTRPESQAQLPVGTTPSTPKLTSDATALQASLAELGRVLAYPDFVDPVHEALKLSNQASLVAIQHSVAAWARLRNDVEGSGVLSCDDGARKFRKLDSLLQEEVLCTCYAFLGKDGVAEFGMVDQVFREQCESKKDMRTPALVVGCESLRPTSVDKGATSRKPGTERVEITREESAKQLTCPATSPVSEATLQRWKDSAQAFEAQQEPSAFQFKTRHGGLTSLCGSNMDIGLLKDLLQDVETFLQTLQVQKDQDVRRAQQGVEAMLAWSRRPLKETEHRELWDLEVVSGFHPPMLSFEWMVASILAPEAPHILAGSMRLQSSEIGSLGLDDQRDLQRLARFWSLATKLAAELGASEEFIDKPPEGGIALDPHFLLFEWLFAKGNLRASQLRLVSHFAEAARSGKPVIRQLLMGEGKSAVVAPLLGLLLASEGLVLQAPAPERVVPDPLLSQSLAMTRALFGQEMAGLSEAFFRPVYHMGFDRSDATSTSAFALLRKVATATKQRAAASQLEEEQAESAACGLSTYGVPAAQLYQSHVFWKELEFTSICLAGVLSTFQSSIGVLDAAWLQKQEVDLLLHPLMSELNFPVGAREPLDLSPERWELPMHLLQPFLCVDVDLEGSQSPAWQTCREEIEKGLQQLALRDSPHLVLVVESFYFKHLEPPLRCWLCDYFRGHGAFKESQVQDLLAALGEEASLSATDRASQLLVLGRDWLRHTLPFVLAKVNRVHYGLLRQKVPFTGLETPSIASEFANPDVAIGLTILAFGHEGMRRSDVKSLLLLLKSDLLRDAGTPTVQRKAFRSFQAWTQSDPDVEASDKGGVLPLDLIQPDPASILSLKKLWAGKAAVYLYYLTREIFPKATPSQTKKLSACAQELASPSLFKVRLGFSGTPSNILPSSLPSVEFDGTTDGKTMAILSSPHLVQIHHLKSGWTPQSVLRYVANRRPRFCALIDTAALLCGLENEEVAKRLMDSPLTEGVGQDAKEACIFLARGTDLPMILLKGAASAVPLEDANILPEKRFCYFDQPHTTGIDINQPSLGVAAITMGKDMSIRELQQGAWRMRGLARGQTLEMRSALEDETAVPLSNNSRALQDIQSCSVEQEELQARQLVRQDLGNVWKSEALQALMAGRREDVEVLLETVSSDVLQRTPQSLQGSLRDLAAPFVKAKPLALAAAVERAVERAVQLLGDVEEHGRGGGGGEIVREQEQQQQLEHQVESEKDTTLNRPRIGESRVWELQQKMEEILGAVTGGDKIQDIHLFAFPSAATIADTLNLASQAGSATQAAKGLEARARLQSLRLRFSPNSRLTSELPVLRPVLVALQIQAASTSSTSTLALSLCEAESIRWILETETESGDVRASFLLHSISEAPMFEAPGPIMAEHHVLCQSRPTLAVSQAAVSFLRFYLGESWFSESESKLQTEAD
ncbi:hypothetical protein AK812_SmicGene21298 [Symbiodinium microadriaticum]|uniref:ubiquitinyl hydrolase 1 n=1 Tax=Symbiodinium microadriaticum TaxID=2951 RepID=A0A1Q9DMP7_SYMMI|nr:hypothetical protein AK812_SmicGene21298 [Symbiodinium microadriaticum]CAE7948105.1 unnamed protein product [Symbiodinium sp. KB8]